MFARYSVLLLAALLAAPALWQAFVIGDLDLDTALVRYLIAVLVAAVMLAFLRMLFNTYHRIHEEHEMERKLEEMRAAEAERRAAAEAQNEGGEAA